MTIYELCKKINLQNEISEKVFNFYETYNFKEVIPYLSDFQDYDKMHAARTRIQDILGNDENNIKILTCMLYSAVYAHEIYKNKGIDDKIYFDTMKCFTRFIDECYKKTKRYAFDREWWTARQTGCHLFRIGELEYEMKQVDNNKPIVSIHIPSDANFSNISCDTSLNLSYKFFAKYFPRYKDCEYRCHSWLLSPVLKEMLSQDSNIISFQNRFDIIDIGEPGSDFIEWLFNTNSTNLTTLPENTTLQRNMKEFLLSGGTVSSPLGILRK